ncbi:beta-phosphoglucomutase [Priestia filamentosa]|uniref:beta-phosphoglucomutase n=1 Tax=Priestia filamentosa TaxID=1402861 RepID=UPI001FB51C64|nr:beta-phosphoglucomutase [Priestia filamentosa]UOE60681.1 beta-phosphoglucomutase [Priestia filamentosa]
MKKIQAVIFDFDGVIVDTVPLYYKATKVIADKLGVTFTSEMNQQLQGVNRKQTIMTLLKDSTKIYSEQEVYELGEQKNEEYKKLIQNLDEKVVLPGIQVFLGELKKRGIPTAVASSSSNAPYLIEKIGLSSYFDHIVDVTKIKKGKPNPEIFLTAARQLQIPPQDCIAIEDGRAGLEGIQKANMFSVGVGEDEMMKNADLYVEKTEELTFEKLAKSYDEFFQAK